MKKIISALLLIATLLSLFSFSLNASAATETVLTTDKTTLRLKDSMTSVILMPTATSLASSTPRAQTLPARTGSALPSRATRQERRSVGIISPRSRRTSTSARPQDSARTAIIFILSPQANTLFSSYPMIFRSRRAMI